jgi:hypothetical protein
MSKKKSKDKVLDDIWEGYYRVFDRVNAVLLDEDPPIPVVMAVCNQIMLEVVRNGTFTKQQVMNVLDQTLDLAAEDPKMLQ